MTFRSPPICHAVKNNATTAAVELEIRKVVLKKQGKNQGRRRQT